MTPFPLALEAVAVPLLGLLAWWILAKYLEARATTRWRAALERGLCDPNAGEEP